MNTTWREELFGDVGAAPAIDPAAGIKTRVRLQNAQVFDAKTHKREWILPKGTPVEVSAVDVAGAGDWLRVKLPAEVVTYGQDGRGGLQQVPPPPKGVGLVLHIRRAGVELAAPPAKEERGGIGVALALAAAGLLFS